MIESDSFSLFASVKVVRELLRRKIDTGAVFAHDELEAGLREIEALWEELRDQSHALASERQRYTEFFEYAPDAYLITDSHGIVREANRAAAELLGVAAAELEGKPLISFVPEDGRREFRTQLVRAGTRQDGEISAWSARLQPRRSPAVEARFRVRALPAADRGPAPLCWLVQPQD